MEPLTHTAVHKETLPRSERKREGGWGGREEGEGGEGGGEGTEEVPYVFM